MSLNKNNGKAKFHFHFIKPNYSIFFLVSKSEWGLLMVLHTGMHDAVAPGLPVICTCINTYVCIMTSMVLNVSNLFYILPTATLSKALRYNGRENAAGEDKNPW